MFERFGALVGCFLLAAEDHRHAALRVELDDHVRAFIRYPDVLFRIDLDRMAVRPCVQIVAYLANVPAVRAELEKLRGGRRVRRTRGIAARQNENMSLAVDGHAGCFSKIDIRRKLQEIGDRSVFDHRRLLGAESKVQQQEQRKQQARQIGLREKHDPA